MGTSSNYTPGDMAVDGHVKTYGGFLNGTVWGAGLIILTCLYAILTFAAQFPLPPALLGTAVVGVLYGLALKMKTGWYALVVGLAIFGAVVSILITILH